VLREMTREGLKGTTSKKRKKKKKAWRGRERDGEDDLTNIQYRPIWNCHNESPPVQ
jgi:hypothetical protein